MSHNIPRPYTRILDGSLESFVVGYVLEHPEVYLCELCQRVENIFGVRASTSSYSVQAAKKTWNNS